MAKGGKAKGPSKKTEQKKQQKVIEDKTFGLKNKKKSKQVQKYVANVQASVKASSIQKAKKTSSAVAAGAAVGGPTKLDKKAKDQAARELALLLRQAPPDTKKKKNAKTDEKSEITGGSEFSGSGTASTAPNGPPQRSGNRRKLVFEKTEKYEPGRRAQRKARNAADNRKFEEPEEEEDPIILEEQIEEERAKLPHEGLTPVTYETFMKWKADREAKWRAEIDSKIEKNTTKSGANKWAGLTGREIFTADSTVGVDDEAADDTKYERPKDEEESNAAASSSDVHGLAKKVDASLYLDDDDDDLSDIEDDE